MHHGEGLVEFGVHVAMAAGRADTSAQLGNTVDCNHAGTDHNRVYAVGFVHVSPEVDLEAFDFSDTLIAVHFHNPQRNCHPDR